MRVLAIDPGLATGIAFFDSETGQTELKIVEGGLEGFKKWYIEDTNRLSGTHLDAVVVESFELEENSHGIDYESPLQIIHWIKEDGFPNYYRGPIVWQRRMERGKNKICSDAVLKRAGLYPKRGAVGAKHQVEALRHALTYLIQKKDRKVIELLHPKD